jgi:hypothetical protein
LTRGIFSRRAAGGLKLKFAIVVNAEKKIKMRYKLKLLALLLIYAGLIAFTIFVFCGVVWVK